MSDLGPEARALIDATRDADVPAQRAKDRVKRRVLARVAAVALAASGSTASTTTAASMGTATAGGALTAKTALTVLVGLAMSALVAGGVATGVVAARGHARPTTSAPSSAAIVPAAPQVPVAAVASVPPATEDRAPPAEAAPAAPTRAAAPHPVATAAEPHAPARAETLEQELPLLASAQAALRSGDTDRALALLAEHARRFPHGALLEERRAAHALAMCRRGREAAAVAEGAAFVRDAPASPLAERVRESCGLR